MGLPQDDIAEQIGTDELLPQREDMRMLEYRVETVLFALFYGFADTAYDILKDSTTAGLEKTTDGSGGSSSSSSVEAGAPECSQEQQNPQQQQQRQRQQQQQRRRHLDAAGQHLVPAGVHEPLVMTVLDAALSKSYEHEKQFPLLMVSTSVAGFAAALLPVSEPTAEATAAAAALTAARRSADADASAAAIAAVEAAVKAVEAAAATNLRVLQALLLRLTPAVMKAAEVRCNAKGHKPLDVRHTEKIPLEGCALAMLCRALSGVAGDDKRLETELPASGERYHP
jgi:hypothetical protein